MAKRFYTRRFLNLPGHHAGAYVLAEVEATGPDDGEHEEPYTNLVLTDCNRQVSFEFPLWSVEDRENSVRKARILAKAFTGFADALEVEAHLSAVRRGAPDAQPDPVDEPEPSGPTRRRERRGRPGHTDRVRRAH